MVSPSTQQIKTSEKIRHIIYQVPFNPDFLDDWLRLEIEGRNFELFTRTPKIINGLCGGALNSTDMLDELKNYDLIIHFAVINCASLVGEFLDIPRVEIFPYPPNIIFNVYHMTPMPEKIKPGELIIWSKKLKTWHRCVCIARSLKSPFCLHYYSALSNFAFLYFRSRWFLHLRNKSKPVKRYDT